MPVAGPHGLAVAPGRVLLAGSSDRRESLVLGRLDTPEVEEFSVVGSDDQPVQKFRAFGRRGHLFLATAATIRVVDMNGS